jgi:hypothetical protein
LVAEFEILPNASGDLGRKPVEVVLEMGHSSCSLLQ